MVYENLVLQIYCLGRGRNSRNLLPDTFTYESAETTLSIWWQWLLHDLNCLRDCVILEWRTHGARHTYCLVTTT
jgi:hypothetical protein